MSHVWVINRCFSKKEKSGFGKKFQSMFVKVAFVFSKVGFIIFTSIRISYNVALSTAWKKVSVFGVILVGILPQSDWIRRDIFSPENVDQNNSEYGHFYAVI